MNDWKRKWTLKLNANIWSTNIFWFVWTLGGQFSISMYNENNHNHDDDDNDDHNDKYRFWSILCYQNLLFIILMMMNYVYRKNNNVYYNILPFHLWYDMFFMVITILNSFRKMPFCLDDEFKELDSIITWQWIIRYAKKESL